MAKLIVFPFLLILLGVSGCEDRLKFIYYDFPLSSCPESNYQFPSDLKMEDWNFERINSKHACTGHTSYLMTNDAFKKGGFADNKQAYGFSFELKREKNCILRVIYSYDPIANKTFYRNLPFYSELVLKGLLPNEVKTTSKNPPSNVIGNLDDLRNWCPSKD